MKKTIILLFTITVLIACKNEKNNEGNIITENTVEKKQEMNEWVTLFDGSSYDNWRGYLTDNIPAEWTIEEGTMAFTPGKQGGKNIISKQKYTNFILSLEWKISKGGNSGIFWSVFEDAKFKEAYETGPEIQVLDNAVYANEGKDQSKHRAGSLYGMIACPEEHIKPEGEWNLCVLEVNHETNLAKVSMNGTQVMMFPVHGEEWDKMVENSKFNGWDGFGKYQTGHIGLQDHGNKVWYKNIKIKEL